MELEKALAKYGLTLPEAPAKGGLYRPAREFGPGFVYLSGCGPKVEGQPVYAGKLGKEITIEQGQAAARHCMLNLVAVLNKYLDGDLSRVKKIVKVLAFVASAEDFYQHPLVVNGGSQLLVDIFGEEVGLGARSSIGVNVLPGNNPVEIELLVEVEPL